MTFLKISCRIFSKFARYLCYITRNELFSLSIMVGDNNVKSSPEACEKVTRLGCGLFGLSLVLCLRLAAGGFPQIAITTSNESHNNATGNIKILQIGNPWLPLTHWDEVKT